MVLLVIKTKLQQIESCRKQKSPVDRTSDDFYLQIIINLLILNK